MLIPHWQCAVATPSWCVRADHAGQVQPVPGALSTQLLATGGLLAVLPLTMPVQPVMVPRLKTPPPSSPAWLPVRLASIITAPELSTPPPCRWARLCWMTVPARSNTDDPVAPWIPPPESAVLPLTVLSTT